MTSEQPDGRKCSFCQKSLRDIARLIAGRGVFICDECVGRCVRTLREESDEGNPHDMTSCALCDVKFPSEYRLDVPSRGPLCAPCAEAVVGAALREVEQIRRKGRPRKK